ncbi:hypothetical protein [Nonomuraea wenchangensis]|uniref:DprA winged helix domain-containing protein n=1 Tax=Nonomuraea wenchangensis TaxID=568860 RepID=A0A1I0IXV7_9ACTN|nr:hypothetical protein [Nonomuraea wenchangensis]SEU02166.1 hypothetical protein SAMN05421811_105273 [Nonomuraea wenchangensis]
MSTAQQPGAAGPVAHVRARSGGPLPLGPGAPAPAGMIRLTWPDSTGQALPVWPDGVTPALLEEYQVAPAPVERAGETRRVLAAVLKCCWTDLSVDPWPGSPAPVELVLDTYRALIGRTDDLMRNWAVGALRRLHDSAWVVVDDGVVVLGPRCALWPVEAHAQLQELVRRLPSPDRAELTVVGDADIVAAAMPTRSAVPAASAESTVPTASAESIASAGSAASTESAVSVMPAPSTGSTRSAPAVSARPAESAGSTVPTASVESAVPTAFAEAVASAPSAESAAPAESAVSASAVVGGGRVEGGGAGFDDLLGAYDERRRAELVAAYMVVEHAAEPVQEVRFAALRDPALRHTLSEMLARRGRVLVQYRDRWISGYDDVCAATPGASGRDEAAAASLPPAGPAGAAGLTGSAGPAAGAGGEGSVGGGRLGVAERAVLTLVLVHSVAIPRAEGLLPEDSWLSPHPTPADELRRHTQLPIGELEAALRTLRHAGLLAQVKAGEEAGGYVPGPQFHRLTPSARRRLQEELILAAGPNTPLAAAVRARRSAR